MDGEDKEFCWTMGGFWGSITWPFMGRFVAIPHRGLLLMDRTMRTLLGLESEIGRLDEVFGNPELFPASILPRLMQTFEAKRCSTLSFTVRGRRWMLGLQYARGPSPDQTCLVGFLQDNSELLSLQLPHQQQHLPRSDSVPESSSHSWQPNLEIKASPSPPPPPPPSDFRKPYPEVKSEAQQSTGIPSSQDPPAAILPVSTPPTPGAPFFSHMHVNTATRREEGEKRIRFWPGRGFREHRASNRGGRGGNSRGDGSNDEDGIFFRSHSASTSRSNRLILPQGFRSDFRAPGRDTRPAFLSGHPHTQGHVTAPPVPSPREWMQTPGSRSQWRASIGVHGGRIGRNFLESGQYPRETKTRGRGPLGIRRRRYVIPRRSRGSLHRPTDYKSLSPLPPPGSPGDPLLADSDRYSRTLSCPAAISGPDPNQTINPDPPPPPPPKPNPKPLPALTPPSSKEHVPKHVSVAAPESKETKKRGTSGGARRRKSENEGGGGRRRKGDKEGGGGKIKFIRVDSSLVTESAVENPEDAVPAIILARHVAGWREPEGQNISSPSSRMEAGMGDRSQYMGAMRHAIVIRPRETKGRKGRKGKVVDREVDERNHPSRH
ncbi:hypothetical protein AAMO2058_000845800 [Amorphochlora amoebiformis]